MPSRWKVVPVMMTGESELPILMRDILDFGESGYIPLDEDTEPNFLGDEMTPSEFAEEEVQDEAMQMGGM